MRQFSSFVRKEFFHILRDRRTMLILLVMPVVLILLFGYAITTEVRGTRVAVYDPSQDALTREICQRIAANRYFDITSQLTSQREAYDLFMQGEVDLVVCFSSRFSEEAVRTENARIQLLADGSEPNQAAVRTGYMQQILASFLYDYAARQGLQVQPRITTSTRMLYNPQSRSEYNFVPGVIGMLLLLICAMMTSISIVREKESGTMEILLASPLPPICIVLAKLVPYFVISCANLATILLLSVFVIGIPVAGSLAGFVGISLLYILVGLLLGLLISTLVGTQLAAMLLSLLLLVPSVYLSGMAFPIESMPTVLQHVSAVMPTRWYISAARKLMIQGVDMRYVLHESVVLALTAALLLAIAWRMFKTRLE